MREAWALRPLAPLERAYRRTIWAITLGILLFAGLQCVWALSIGSRQLLKDGLDWGYDVVLYALAAVVFGRGERIERGSAVLIGVVLAAAGFHTLYDLWDKVQNPRPIEILTIGFSAASAIVISLLTVWAMWRFRRAENPLIQATWLSTRNSVISTAFFVVLIVVVRLSPVRWPEYAVDLVFAGLNFQAAGRIFWTERRQRQARAAGTQAA